MILTKVKITKNDKILKSTLTITNHTKINHIKVKGSHKRQSRPEEATAGALGQLGPQEGFWALSGSRRSP